LLPVFLGTAASMPIPDMPRSSLDTLRSILDPPATKLDMPHSSLDIHSSPDMPVTSSGLPAMTDKNGGR
jgi:hypothetical protein